MKQALTKSNRGGALISVEQELLARAQVAKATEESVALGQFFQLQGGVLAFNGSPIKDNKMEVIVVDHILQNTYYKGKFKADTPQTPVCYAFGRNDKEMKPHQQCSEPQHEQCKGCEWNEFGTSDLGRGKACKNGRRLACVSADVLGKPEGISDAPLAYLTVPVTSVRGWAGYVQQLANALGVPPLGVVTEVEVVKDAKTQFKVTFKAKERITDKQALSALLARQKLVAGEIAFPFPEIEEGAAPRKRAERVAPPPQRGGRGGGGAAFGAPRKFARR